MNTAFTFVSTIGGAVKDVNTKWTLYNKGIREIEMVQDAMYFHQHWGISRETWEKIANNETAATEVFGPLGKKLVGNRDLVDAIKNIEVGDKALNKVGLSIVEQTKKTAVKDVMKANANLALLSLLELAADANTTYQAVTKSRQLRHTMSHAVGLIDMNIAKGKSAASRVQRIWDVKHKFRFDLYTQALAFFDAAMASINTLLASLVQSQDDITTQRNIHATKSFAALLNLVLTGLQIAQNPVLGAAKLSAQVAVGGYTVAAAGHGFMAYYSYSELQHICACIAQVQQRQRDVKAFVDALESVKDANDKEDEDADVI